jgi:hypothetical protein
MKTKRTTMTTKQTVLRPSLGAVAYVGGRIVTLAIGALLVVVLVVAVAAVCLIYLYRAVS